MSGKPGEPITVHLPNVLEPFFSVTDNGPGMSHESILGLFTTFFGSNKTDTNQATGMLGLGSKSAFSYTTTYMVTSKHGGFQRVYNCFVSKDGIPEIALVSETPLGNPNETGIEVKFAVDRADFQEFLTKAQSVYKYYSPLPRITGNKIDLTPQKVVMELTDSATGITVKVLESNSNRYGYSKEGSRAVQGAASYPIDASKLNAGNKYTTLLQSNVLLSFPIGAINITASREHIEYDDDTRKAIIAACDMAIVMLSQEVTKTFKSIDNIYDACKKASELSVSLPIWGLVKYAVSWTDAKGASLSLEGLTNYRFKWSPSKEVPVIDPTTGKQQTNNFGNPMKTREYSADIQNASHHSLTYYKSIRFSDYNKGYDHGTIALGVLDKACILVEDVPVLKFNHILEFNFRGNTPVHTGISELYFVRPRDGLHSKVVKEIQESFKGFKVVLFSSLQQPPVVPKVAREKRKILGFDTHNSYNWKDVTHDVTLGGIYVDVFRNDVVGIGSYSDLKELLNVSLKCGLFDHTATPVYGFPASYKNIPKNNPGWENLLDVLEKACKAKLVGKDIKKAQDDERNLVFIQNNKNTWMHLFYQYKDHAKDIKAFVDECLRIEQLKKGNTLDIAGLLGKIQQAKAPVVPTVVTTPVVSVTVDEPPKSTLDVMLEKLQERYPLITEYHPKGSHQGARDSFKQYVILINTFE